MKILSITTSSSICGVAILENTTLIKEININNGLTHSETLMPTISQILSETNLSLNDINLLVVDIGPGSFTGIRIGMSSIKAFIDSLNIPGIGVSSLESLAYNVQKSAVICSMIDARKENVYVQIFEFLSNKYIVRRNASFENIDSFLDELKTIQPEYNITFVGDGAVFYKNKILEALPNSEFWQDNVINAKSVGLAGFVHYINQDFASLNPLYLRKSQAEQKLEETLHEKN